MLVLTNEDIEQVLTMDVCLQAVVCRGSRGRTTCLLFQIFPRKNGCCRALAHHFCRQKHSCKLRLISRRANIPSTRRRVMRGFDSEISLNLFNVAKLPTASASNHRSSRPGGSRLSASVTVHGRGLRKAV